MCNADAYHTCAMSPHIFILQRLDDAGTVGCWHRVPMAWHHHGHTAHVLASCAHTVWEHPNPLSMCVQQGHASYSTVAGLPAGMYRLCTKACSRLNALGAACPLQEPYQRAAPPPSCPSWLPFTLPLADLSVLEIIFLVAMKRLEDRNVASYNFEVVFKEYDKFVRGSGSGPGFKYGKGVGRKASHRKL